jgi:predicted MPP superfamily phosphohydrolase
VTGKPRRPGRSFFLVAGILLGFFILLLIDAFLVEPYSPAVVKKRFIINDWPDELNNFTIVQISDLHTGNLGKRERIAIREINDANPELILITGDFIQYPQSLDNCKKFIASLRAKYGIWGVFGNWDHYVIRNPRKLQRAFEGSAIKILNNAHQAFEVQGRRFWLVGVDDMRTGDYDLKKALRGIPEGDCKILMSHTPDVIGDVKGKRISLILSGHTHGGQVRLPFYGAVITMSHYGKKYEMGEYRVGDTVMYVSRGLGTSTVPVRFMCRPEITVIHCLPLSPPEAEPR